MHLRRLFILSVLILSFQMGYPQQVNDREYWLQTMTKIIDPIFENLSSNTLRKNMPVETNSGSDTENRKGAMHLEALGRSFCGIAPWLNLPADNTPEGKLRAKYVDLVIRSIINAVDPQSPDYMPFDRPGSQPLVDAAFFAQGLLRSKDQIWAKLNEATQTRIIEEMKASRKIKPFMNNWLLFSAMIEAALLELTGECDLAPIQFAISKHEEWYKGDGWYGDGPNFHLDYYNSYVIQPMLIDILSVLKSNGKEVDEMYNIQLKRIVRYAQQQEILIAPDGTYPPFGRSTAYRFGAFQVLAQTCLMKQYPEGVTPGQIRSALTAVLKRQTVPETFDKEGWLTLGFVGHQPQMAENYVSTGSAYLCTFVFLPLGLSQDDEFWVSAPQDWTSKKAWSGDSSMKRDAAIKDEKASIINLTE